jgi:hypothetical protein
VVYKWNEAGTAAFLGIDSDTQGDWAGIYGDMGHVIPGGSTSLPEQVSLGITHRTHVWASGTDQRRALRLPGGTPDDRFAGTWVDAAQLRFPLNFSDGKENVVSFYYLDLDTTLRTSTIRLLDARTGSLLSEAHPEAYNEGRHVVFRVRGDLIIESDRTGGYNAVLSGLFIGLAPTSPAFEIQRNAGELVFVFEGADETAYRLFESSDLRQWTPLVNEPVIGILKIPIDEEPGGSKFFRWELAGGELSVRGKEF